MSAGSSGVALAGLRDHDGNLPLGAYGVLGDGRGAALVGLDGRVDWWSVSHLDSPPTFAAVLDPARGGAMTLAPTCPDARAEHRYLPHTNVLETTFTTSTGRVRLTDALNSGAAGALPWSELVRRVEGLEGRVELELVVRPGDGLRQWEPWVDDDPRGPVVHAGPVTLGVRASPGVVLATTHRAVTARFTVDAGQREVVGLVASDAAPLFLCDVEAVDRRLDTTVESWRRWSAGVTWPGAGRERILRSALALKVLVMARTGAVAAAATTSLPERVGGPKNWDYRFCWVRDAALTIDALADLGLHEEVHAAVAWLLRAIADNGPDVRVMYTLDGGLPAEERHPDVAGYLDSRPVRIGNRAAGQRQLGVYGDLFGTVADWVFGGHVLDVGSARLLADLADRCADSWRDDDAGLWELTDSRPYTSSKMNCWRALDAAARLAEAGHLAGSATRWRHEADAVRAWVEEHCWSATKQAYTFWAGTDRLDASVLLGAHLGFDRGPRMSSTIDALTTELGTGALMYRYSGVEDEEQTFLACAYWRAHALVAVGRLDEAQEQLERLDALWPPLGILSEMVDPETHEMVGNLPQALSHLAHVRAASAVRTARAASTHGAR